MVQRYPCGLKFGIHIRFDSAELSSKHDSKNSELLLVNGNDTFSSNDRNPPIKKSDTNSSTESSFNNRVKRKDNKASTYGLIRNEDLIKDGLTPWRSRNFYNPGLLGYVLNFVLKSSFSDKRAKM